MAGLIEQVIEAGFDNADHFAKGIQGAATGGYYIQQDPEEFAKLISTLRNHAPYHTALSIGIAAGGNDRFMVEKVDIKQLVVMDDGKHWNHKVWKATNKPAIKIPVHEHIGNSHSRAAASFLKDLGFKFNLIGIDGDHSPAGVRMDWEMVQPYLAPGAVVWFHDIAMKEAGQTGAAELWFELRKKHKVLLETRKKFGIGVVQV
jgi:hypothetical protein